jgi:hypothetical protein
MNTNEDIEICSEDESIRGLSDLYFPEEAEESHSSATGTRDAADILLEMGKLTPQQHAHLRQQQAAKPASDAAALLLEAGLVNADDVSEAKAKLHGLTFRHIEPTILIS